MGFGNRGTSWLACLTGAISLLIQLVTSCQNGTYYSRDSGACIECPAEPLLQCTYVDQNDIRSCLKNCLVNGKSSIFVVNASGNVIKQAHLSLLSSYNNVQILNADQDILSYLPNEITNPKK